METLTSGSLGLYGGRLCLDFVNTANRDDRGGIAREFLGDYGDMLAWGRHVGLLSQDDRGRLERLVGNDQSVGNRVRQDCLALRESLYRFIRGHGACPASASGDLERLNAALLLGGDHSGLVAAEGRLAFAVNAHLSNWLTAPVAWSASDLLTSDKIAHVKTCPGTDCGWQFLDTTRNRSRRWCSMTTCGNRAKVRAHYQRGQA